MGNYDLVIQIISECSWLNLNILISGKDYINRNQAIEKACTIWETHRVNYTEIEETGSIKTINILEVTK